MKILVVEDNEKLQKLLSHLLEKEGYDVFCASGGKAALALYGEQRPDIICLDVMMEDASGIDICRDIRRQDQRVTILMITSKSRDVDIEAGIAAGANDYIVKPFETSDITARMKAITRACIARDEPERARARFSFGDISVFPGQLRAERAGVSLDLNLRDVGLLKLFYDHKGKTVSNSELKNYCWMMQSAQEDKAVQWYIGHLRKKIEKDPENPALIKALPEGGYRHD